MLTILLNMFFYLQWIPEGQSEVKDRLLVGLSDGEVLLMEGPDVRNSFSCDNGLSVESVVCYSKGFVVGQDNGVVTIFEKDEKDVYRKARSFTVENNQCKVK